MRDSDNDGAQNTKPIKSVVKLIRKTRRDVRMTQFKTSGDCSSLESPSGALSRDERLARSAVAIDTTSNGRFETVALCCPHFRTPRYLQIPKVW